MIKITSEKRSDYEIIYPVDASPSQKTAALELKKYLFRITGAMIPEFTDNRREGSCEIVLGFTNRGEWDDALCEKLGDEGFRIKTVGEKIFILGSGVRGTLYGVYEFLEKYCGCLFMTNDYESVPRRETLEVAECDDEQIPVFMSRNPYWYPVRDEGISAKLKINGCSDRVLTERVGGGVYYAGDFQHTLGYLAEQCPEGERAWVQPCLSDENVYQTVLKNVRRKLRECPHAKIMSITQNDGDTGACKCDRCRAVNEREESEMGTMLAFVNRIARELKDEYPDVLFDTFAYRFTRKPPKTIMPEDNVIVRLCSIECCFRHAHEDCHETPGHEEPSEPFSEQLVEWARRTKHLFIWDYTTDFTNYSTSFMNIPILRKNVRFFADNGAEGVFEQGNIFCPNGEFGELKGYLLARLLWDPYMTEEEYRCEIDRFCEGYYGKGGKYIRELIDYMAECSKDSHFGIYFDNASIYIKPSGFATEREAKFAYIKRAEELYNKARALAETDEELSHINCSEIQLYNYKFFVWNE
ncbi:MAG: DUF4838 domain-containing protein, partial [Clostridia bacterium]|nr:DUF4838 domain-containing protein [Clostridia bacterium]